MGIQIDHTETYETLFANLQKAMSDRAECDNEEEMLTMNGQQLSGLVTNKDLSASNELSWRLRVNLFFMSPVTIFIMDALAQFFQIMVFMTFLLHADNLRVQVTWVECALAFMQASNSFIEFVQILVEGLSSYFDSKWNWIQMLSVTFFWLGFHDVSHRTCRPPSLSPPPSSSFPFSTGGASSSSPGNPYTPTPHPSGDCRLASHGDSYYAVALFFMWLRVLRLISVNKDLGPLVVVIGRMGRDMCVFGVIWMVLLLAFSTAVYGAEITSQATGQCENTGGTRGGGLDIVRMRCWSSWWILRTYYQAFGQPFFEDLTTDGSNVWTIIMWPVMNLMLVNLLIAIMNDTYAEVKRHSKLEWMVEMMQLAKEYRSPSRLNALMLLYDIASFLFRKDDIDQRLAKLVGGQKPKTFFAWIEDCRFKFKKFQCRDIPSIAVADQQRSVEALISHLDKQEAPSSHRLPHTTSGTSLLSLPELRSELHAHAQDAQVSSIATIVKIKTQFASLRRMARDNLDDLDDLRSVTPTPPTPISHTSGRGGA